MHFLCKHVLSLTITFCDEWTNTDKPPHKTTKTTNTEVNEAFCLVTHVTQTCTRHVLGFCNVASNLFLYTCRPR